ncbi:MAG: IS110 family transposase [Methanobacteriota archaeon]|nr:MAG: IS110 family transposase [Euryarchaeota archaeon]
MRHYAAIDLHSTNGYLGMINEEGRGIFCKRVPNDLSAYLEALAPHKHTVTGIVVESTFNWYWLVDGLQDNGYKVHLANPAGIQQYRGLKHQDDKSDAFFLAELFRLNILPEGYIYPKATRPLRDLLRKRLWLIHNKTRHLLSLKSFIARHTGKQLSSNTIKKMTPEDLETYVTDEHLQCIGQADISMHQFYQQEIQAIEKKILAQIKPNPTFTRLKTVPGIGRILAMTIYLETGDINRFPKAGNYASYCRCVQSNRISNGKKKGCGNRKNGNVYLGWAYIEAAQFMKRYAAYARRYYQRKRQRRNGAVAAKSLAAKIAKACYYIMRDKVVFDHKLMFHP